MNASILTLFLSCLLTLAGFSQGNIEQEKLIEDFDYAVAELKLQHQGYGNYTSRDQIDVEIEKLRNEIHSSQTKIEFYQLVRRLVALMNEGHGSVDLARRDLIRIGLPKSFLPVAVKYLDGQWIVTQNYGKEVAGLSKGMRLLAVNDESVESIYQRLSPLIATDGFNETSSYQWMGGITFSLLYRLVYGPQSAYKLKVESYETHETHEVILPPVRFTKFKAKNGKYERLSFEYTRFTFRRINDSIAYLCVPDFSLGEIDYESFYETSFRKIDSLDIKHLIIDVQANTGGEEGNENLLFSYLSDVRLQKYRKATMLPIPYQKRKDYESIKLDKWVLKDSIAERGAFTLYSDYYSELGYTPPKSAYIYDQKVYVLTSGLTFSGGAEFSSMVRMSKRGLFIGEETGGAYEGNISSFNETIRLPHTRISIDIPIVHYQIDVG